MPASQKRPDPSAKPINSSADRARARSDSNSCFRCVCPLSARPALAGAATSVVCPARRDIQSAVVRSFGVKPCTTPALARNDSQRSLYSALSCARSWQIPAICTLYRAPGRRRLRAARDGRGRAFHRSGTGYAGRPDDRARARPRR